MHSPDENLRLRFSNTSLDHLRPDRAPKMQVLYSIPIARERFRRLRSSFRDSNEDHQVVTNDEE